MEIAATWVTILGKLPEIVMALLFAAFAIRLIQMQQENGKNIMEDWAKRLEQQQAAWQTFLTNLSESNREMWRTHDENFAKVMKDHDTRTAEMIRLLCQTFEALQAKTTRRTRETQEK